MQGVRNRVFLLGQLIYNGPQPEGGVPRETAPVSSFFTWEHPTIPANFVSLALVMRAKVCRSEFIRCCWRIDVGNTPPYTPFWEWGFRFVCR